MQLLFRATLKLALVGSCMMHCGFAQEEVDPQRDEDLTAIKAAIQSYAKAFNARDAQKLADHWAPEGVYISRTSGDQVTGRAAMFKEFAAMFAQQSVPQLDVATESIEFISPNVALERGAVTVKHADDSVSLSNYRVVYVKQAGEWLIDRVTEEETEVQASNYEKLKELEWIIGVWVDDSEGLSIKIECDWTKNQNFISRRYSVSQDGEIESSGLQIIGWDPNANQIRSWLFDSGGGFVDGSWSRSDDQWIIQSVATLPGGGSGSYTSIFRPLEEGRYAWRKINRVVDGEILPNVDQVIVTRN